MITKEREQAIIDSVRTQAEAGFNDSQILDNLISEGYTKEEVDPYLENVSSLTSSQRTGFQTILFGVFVFCVLKGLENTRCAALNPACQSIFTIYMVIAAITFILFIVLLSKRKPFK